MTKRLIATAALMVIALASVPSRAATLVTDCSIVGLDDIIPNAQACVGYFDKNVLKTDAGDFASTDEVDALNLLGLPGSSITVLEKLNNSGNFAALLNGLTWIGVHYGAGKGPVSTSGGVTAFYRFDAGTNLDSFGFANGSVSGVSLYATGRAAPVPEPAVWGLMLIGFGMVGGAMRRRKVAVSFS